MRIPRQHLWPGFGVLSLVHENVLLNAMILVSVRDLLRVHMSRVLRLLDRPFLILTLLEQRL